MAPMGPFCKPRVFTRGYDCCATLRKRELLKTCHFRQLARKRKGNFGKKREDWTVPALLTSFLNQKQVIVPCSQTVSASVQTFRHPRSERFAATANSNGDSAWASIRYVEHLMHLWTLADCIVLFYFYHTVAHTNMCLDVLRGILCWLQLFPQCCHKDPERSNIVFRAASPYLLSNICMCQYFSNITR